jgi:hypothetical protein
MVVHLHLASVFASRGSFQEAAIERMAAQPLEPIVEHGYVRSFAAEVDRDLRESRTFTVVGGREPLDRETMHNLLDSFLICEAKAQAPSREGQAVIFGSSATYMYRREFELRELGHPVGEPLQKGRPRKMQDIRAILRRPVLHENPAVRGN